MDKSNPEFQVGKLYETQTYFWLVFPSEQIALAAAARSAVATATAQAARSRYWSRELNCSVGFVDPNSTFLVLSVSYDKQRIEVLFEDSLGWINAPEWSRKYLKRATSVS